MRKYLAILVLFIGCENIETNKRSARIAIEQLPPVIYFQDKRTDLCFAYSWQNENYGLNVATGGPVLTNVPCTEKVLNQLHNK